MGRGIDFHGSNGSLGPPKGVTEEEIYTLPVYISNGHVVSCWYLSDEEIAEVVKSRCVWLSVMGKSMQPAFVGSLEAVNVLLNEPESKA